MRTLLVGSKLTRSTGMLINGGVPRSARVSHKIWFHRCTTAFASDKLSFASQSCPGPRLHRKEQELPRSELENSNTRQAYRKRRFRAKHNSSDQRHRITAHDKPFAGGQATESFITTVIWEIRKLARSLENSNSCPTIGVTDPLSHSLASSWLDGAMKSIETWGRPENKRKNSKLNGRLRRAYDTSGTVGVHMELRFALQSHVASAQHDRSGLTRQRQMADLRYPAEWYPNARMMSREIHLHIGPTNSGKTYHALERLYKAPTGVYAGPLRLLAHEVYSRILSRGRSCHLVTGDERIISDDVECMLSSSTVEMAPLSVNLDVAVIDEIQMIGDAERGWAWTQAVLGVQAREIHLCGEARALHLVRELAALAGDNLIVHEYERLTRLEVSSTSLGRLEDVRQGDCLVAFSRRLIHFYSTQITRLTNKKVAVVYGSLPPETRAEQARLFNDPTSGYDVIVASNAIGMGLNLSIKRLIFTSTVKWDGHSMKQISTSELKQVGGRAGRYRVAPSAGKWRDISNSNLDLISLGTSSEGNAEAQGTTGGIITSLHDEDLAIIRQEMAREPEPITSAGLKYPDRLILRFASYFPSNTPLGYILTRLNEVSRLSARFKLCDFSDNIGIANAIQGVKELSLADRLIFIASPASYDNPEGLSFLLSMAKCVASPDGGDLLSLPSIDLEILDEPITPNVIRLRQLETLHKCLTLYLWLSYRFSGVFVSQPLAIHVKRLVETSINLTLQALAQDEHCKKTTLKTAHVPPGEVGIFTALQVHTDKAALKDSAGRDGSDSNGAVQSDSRDLRENDAAKMPRRGQAARELFEDST